MSTVTYRLVITPPSFWGEGKGEAGPATGFVRDALDIERRIPKGVNLESERSRYFLCCRRIQDAARESDGYNSAKVLGGGYLQVLHALGARPGTRLQFRQRAADVKAMTAWTGRGAWTAAVIAGRPGKQDRKEFN